MGSFSIWHWLIVLAIVILIFGTKKLGNIGGDIGSAIRNFKKSMNEEQHKPDVEAEPKKLGSEKGRVIDAQVTKKVKKKKA